MFGVSLETIKTTAEQSLLCALKSVPVAGRVVEVWDGVANQRAQLNNKAAIKAVEAGLTRVERGQRGIIKEVFLELLDELRQPRLRPEVLSEALREFVEMQSQEYMVGVFEGMLQDNRHYSELLKNPQAYGQLLKPEESIQRGMMPLFLRLEEQPQILQMPMFAFQSLLMAGTEGEAQSLGSDVWGLPKHRSAARSSEPRWWLHLGGEQQGPFKKAQLEETGMLRPETPVWTQGMKGWTRAAMVEALGALLPSLTPPPRPSPKPPPPPKQPEAGELMLEKSPERPALVYIPSGSFMMGSPDGEGEDDEHPQHRVELTRPFLMAATPVTQGQYEAVMENNPSHFKGKSDGSRHPVEYVSWNPTSPRSILKSC